MDERGHALGPAAQREACARLVELGTLVAPPGRGTEGGALARAIARWARLPATLPDPIPRLAAQCEALQRKERSSDAVALARAETHRNPEDPRTWALLARCLESCRDRPAAREALARALRIARGRPGAGGLLAHLEARALRLADEASPAITASVPEELPSSLLPEEHFARLVPPLRARSRFARASAIDGLAELAQSHPRLAPAALRVLVAHLDGRATLDPLEAERAVPALRRLADANGLVSRPAGVPLTELREDELPLPLQRALLRLRARALLDAHDAEELDEATSKLVARARELEDEPLRAALQEAKLGLPTLRDLELELAQLDDDADARAAFAVSTRRLSALREVLRQAAPEERARTTAVLERYADAPAGPATRGFLALALTLDEGPLAARLLARAHELGEPDAAPHLARARLTRAWTAFARDELDDAAAALQSAGSLLGRPSPSSAATRGSATTKTP